MPRHTRDAVLGPDLQVSHFDCRKLDLHSPVSPVKGVLTKQNLIHLDPSQ